MFSKKSKPEKKQYLLNKITYFRSKKKKNTVSI